MTLHIETLPAIKHPLAQRFYKEHQAAIRIGSRDQVSVARLEGTIVAAYRLTQLNRDDQPALWLLRNMLVAPAKQRQGIGRQLLLANQQNLRGLHCYCFPYLHLQAFYTRAGFARLDSEASPELIQAKFFQYRQQGRKILLMQAR